MKPFWRTKNIQLRWAEPLGEKDCPYAYRWVLILFGYSLRVHHFIRSDDKRYYHDHAWWFVTMVISGFYIDVSENSKQWMPRWFPVYRPAHHKHYVHVPDCGAWTILITGRPKRKWGFWVDGKMKRPLKYFHRYGHPPCTEQ